MSEVEKMDSTEPQSNGNETEPVKKVEPAESNESMAKSDQDTEAANGGMDGQAKEEQKDEKMDASSVKSEQPEKNYDDMPAYKMFMSKNLNKVVAANLMAMFEELGLTTEEFDDRAVEMLATFPVEQGNFIIKELKSSHLYGVQNKPQYLMSVMRNFRDRLRSMGVQPAMDLPLIPGPDPGKIKELIDRTGYQLEVTVGQRKYHTPPGYEGPDPNQSDGRCVYIGQIPKEVYEDELVPLFESLGTIFDLRIMMDPVMGKSRGYGFIIYCDKASAAEAAKKYDGHEIQPGKPLKVNVSVANTRLFLGNIPKSKSKDEILDELRKHTENVVDVIIYLNPDAHDGRKNRGFCFVDFTDHKAASDAKRRISMGKIRPWNTDLVVDWAEQQDEPDEETMQQVKVLYVRNLKEAVTEERLNEMFEKYGEIEKVKRIKDYAFIHFKERDSALQAMQELNKTTVEGVEVEISLAKPQGDQNQKKKIAMKQRVSGPHSYGAATPGLGRGNRGGGGGGGYGQSNRGRGSGPNMRGGYHSYAGYPPPPPPGYMPGYDPYAAAYGGYAPGYGPGYDMYAGGYAVDPYYGGGPPAMPPYGGGPQMRGGGVGASGYGTIQRGRGGKPTGASRGGRGGKRGGAERGVAKRAGGDFGGPASKRGGRTEDFSSDINMNNMF